MLRPGLLKGLRGDRRKIKELEGRAFTSRSPAADKHSGLPGNTSSGTESGNSRGTDSHFIPIYGCCALYFCQKKKRQSSPKRNMIYKFFNKQNKVTI